MRASSSYSPSSPITTTASQHPPTTATEWMKTSHELSARVNLLNDRQQKRRRQTVRPRIADAYVEACAVCAGSSTVSRSVEVQAEKQVEGSSQSSSSRKNPAETYGELHTDDVYRMLEVCASTLNARCSELSLLDIGSGYGRLVLLASLFCERTAGVELVETRHEAALSLLREFGRRVHPLVPAGEIVYPSNLTCGDMFGVCWSGYNIVYACSTCFGPEMMERIAEKCVTELDSNAILCTVTHRLPDISSVLLQQIKTTKFRFTWGEETVFMYQKKIATKEEEVGKEGDISASIISPADKYNKAGSMLQNLGRYEKAISQYRTALKKDKLHASSHFNMATCLCYLADKSDGVNIAVAFRRKARSHYLKATENSSKGFGEAHSNLAVLYLKENMLDEALASCEVALKLHDIGTMSYNKAFWNLSSVLRRLGRKDGAILRAWETIEGASALFAKEEAKEETSGASLQKEQGKKFTRPPIIQCHKHTTTPAVLVESESHVLSETLSVVCVKWGTKYDAQYVLLLYAGVLRNLSIPFNFVCFTDDTSGLEHEAGIQCISLETGWQGWWNKASLFSSSFPLRGRIMYIDLDTVITGSLEEMTSYRGDFAILSTRGIDNEGKDFSNGYNSSILMWAAGSSKLDSICEVLREHFDLVHNFIHRFDHWLEMMVADADLIQDIYPEYVVDFVHACTKSVPKNARIVVFPLRPKPHEFPAPWVKDIWCSSSTDKGSSSKK